MQDGLVRTPFRSPERRAVPEIFPAMSPITIDDNFPSFSDDSEVLRSRLFGDELLDAAIIGTVVNDEGNRVIVYAEDNLIYLISLRVESGELASRW